MAYPSSVQILSASAPSSHPVGEPSFKESLIPVLGSGKASINHFQLGNYYRGTLYAALAVSDIFLVKAIGTSLIKLGARGMENMLTRQGPKIVAGEGAQEVVHLTTPVAAEKIAASAKIGGRLGIFALESSQVPLSSFGRSTRTFVTGNLSGEIRIGGEALTAFSRPPLFGPFSIWRNAVGVRSTPLGSIDLAGEKFIANEIFVNGIFKEATDAEIKAFARHQFLLDYGFDIGIYTVEATQAWFKNVEFGNK